MNSNQSKNSSPLTIPSDVCGGNPPAAKLAPLILSPSSIHMNLDRQIQSLIDDAPDDGITPHIVNAIAPGLKQLAAKLHHQQYFIVQSFEGDWVVTTISDRQKPKIEQRVIYAFPTLQDIPKNTVDSQLIAVPMPVTHILFQLLALETVDSIVFLEIPGDANAGYEIKRADIQKLVQVQLKPKSPFNQIPPDLA